MSEQKKRMAWFAVFMIWLGMVSSILVYQMAQEGLDSAQNASNNPAVEVNKSQKPVIIEKMSSGQGQNQNQNQGNGTKPDPVETPKDLQLSKVKEENPEKDFFVQYRLNRDRARQEQISTYRDMVNNPNTDPSVKKTVQEEILFLTKQIEQEMEIESLIRARGYHDALAYMHEDSIDLIIQTDGLTETQVAQVGDIVTRITELRVEDITIIEKRITKN